MWPVSTQSPISWNDFTGVFFFLLIHPGVEKTPCGQTAPCSQTAPWSHPYIPMWPVSTQSPSRLQSPWWWVSSMRPASILWLDSTLVPPRLIHWGQSAPLVLPSYTGIHPGDEETPCGQLTAWSHPHLSQCGQSAPWMPAGSNTVSFSHGSQPSNVNIYDAMQHMGCAQQAPDSIWQHSPLWANYFL